MPDRSASQSWGPKLIRAASRASRRIEAANQTGTGLPEALEDQRIRLTVAGIAPPSLLLLALAGVLSGTEPHPVKLWLDVPGTEGGSSGPSAIAWVSLVLLMLMSGLAVLPWVTGFLGRAFLDPALVTAELRVQQRYGLRLQAVLPRLVQLAPPDTKEMIAHRGRRLAWTLGAIAGYGLALVLSGVLLALVQGEPPIVWILVPIATVGLAYSWLADAGTAAFRYAEALETAVDLHRFDVLRALHLPLPGDPEEERRVNRYLSRVLEEGRRSELPYEHAEAEERTTVPTPETGMSKETGVSKRAEDRSLVNWSGHVSLTVEGVGREPVDGTDDTVQLEPKRPYTLVVHFAEKPRGVSDAPIDISDGITEMPVVFDLLLNSTSVILPPLEQRVVVQRGMPASARIEFVAPSESGQHGIVVQILQRHRLIQIVSLRATVEGTEQARVM